MKKHKKLIHRSLKVSAIAISLVCLAACGGSAPFIIPIKSSIIYTKDELIDQYWEHKDKLNEVAEIVLASDSLLQEIIDNKDLERDVWSSSQKKHFSEDDWEKIVDLYENIRPYTIERERFGAIGIYFNLLKADNNYVSYSLHYFRDEETLEYYQKNRWKKEFEHLDGYWYISSLIMPR